MVFGERLSFWKGNIFWYRSHDSWLEFIFRKAMYGVR